MYFIYVATRTDKAKLEDMGYELVKEDLHNHIWAFAAKDDLFFSYDEDEILTRAGISFVASSTLTF